jgi:glutaredoxin
MKQECPLPFVWLTWLALPGLALLLWWTRGWPAAVLVILVGVVVQITYLRVFPRISRWVGYGSVKDVPAGEASAGTYAPRVTLYTANVCPFCPIVKRRLMALKQQVPFALDEIDVTFKPHIVVQKGFRSVPVIESQGRYLVGNATSAELSAFLGDAAREAGTRA